MNLQLSEDKITELCKEKCISDLSVKDLFLFFSSNKLLHEKSPEPICFTDPRNNNIIIHAPKRLKRPINESECAICNGDTTSIIDIAKLSEGMTFINMNLYPAVFPFKQMSTNLKRQLIVPDTDAVPKELFGLHFLQWTSSIHDKDWHNITADDCKIVLQRLTALEKKLLLESKEYMISSKEWSMGRDVCGFVSIIKNVGIDSGSSMPHGHQQIIFSNNMPKATMNNWTFMQQYGKPFSEHIINQTPKELLINDYDKALLAVPIFMHRPFHMMLLLKDSSKQYFHELNEQEIEAVAKGINHASIIMNKARNSLNNPISYNILFHNGPGAGLYIEFFPCTQRIGGFENLGMWICVNNPKNVTSICKDLLAN